MKEVDYLKSLKSDEDVTFVIIHVVKDEHTPFYHYEYYQTPIRLAWEWLEGIKEDNDYIVIKKDTCPIDITGSWDNWYKRGRLKCCMLMKKSDFFIKYSETQANMMINHYEEIIK